MHNNINNRGGQAVAKTIEVEFVTSTGESVATGTYDAKRWARFEAWCSRRNATVPKFVELAVRSLVEEGA